MQPWQINTKAALSRAPKVHINKKTTGALSYSPKILREIQRVSYNHCGYIKQLSIFPGPCRTQCETLLIMKVHRLLLLPSIWNRFQCLNQLTNFPSTQHHLIKIKSMNYQNFDSIYQSWLSSSTCTLPWITYQFSSMFELI